MTNCAPWALKTHCRQSAIKVHTLGANRSPKGSAVSNNISFIPNSGRSCGWTGSSYRHSLDPILLAAIPIPILGLLCLPLPQMYMIVSTPAGPPRRWYWPLSDEIGPQSTATSLVGVSLGSPQNGWCGWASNMQGSPRRPYPGLFPSLDTSAPRRDFGLLRTYCIEYSGSRHFRPTQRFLLTKHCVVLAPSAPAIYNDGPPSRQALGTPTTSRWGGGTWCPGHMRNCRSTAPN